MTSGSSLASALTDMDAGVIALKVALQRRLDGCQQRRKLLTKKKGSPGKPPRLGWFPFGGEIEPEVDIFQTGDRAPAPNTTPLGKR